jgi:hypothetical protein
MGLNMKEKQAVTREYQHPYQKASKKEKQALLNQFIRLTGYHRKSAIRLLTAQSVKQVMVYLDGQGGKAQTGKEATRQPERKASLFRGGRCLVPPGLDLFLVLMRENSRPPLCGNKCPSSQDGRPSKLPPTSPKNSKS